MLMVHTDLRFIAISRTPTDAARYGASVYHSVPVYVPAFTDIVLLGNRGSWMCTTCLDLLPDSKSSSQFDDLQSDTTLLTTKLSETGVAVENGMDKQ